MGNSISISCQTSASDFVLSPCFKSTCKGTRYLYELRENLDALKTALEELTDSKNNLMRRVSVAEPQQQLRRLDKVQRWISRVYAMEAEVNELMLRSTQEINKLCLWGCCSEKYISSYKFGKKVTQKLSAVADLQSKGVFEVVADRELAASVVETPLEPTVGLESLLEKAWKDLNDVNVRIIGLCGMGGVGKSNLLKNISNNFLRNPGDYNVIWSSGWWYLRITDLRTYRMLLAKKIGYSDETWRRRDYHQFSVLSRRKFVLLLDDIWERVDLTKLGVPLLDKLNESKVVFTTRSKDLCCHIRADEMVEVKYLPWDKSGNLFKKMLCERSPQCPPKYPSLAKTVAKECAGLPLALVAVGHAMACKRMPRGWNYAIQVLKNSA